MRLYAGKRAEGKRSHLKSVERFENVAVIFPQTQILCLKLLRMFSSSWLLSGIGIVNGQISGNEEIERLLGRMKR
jgi:hypothetical protein